MITCFVSLELALATLMGSHYSSTMHAAIHCNSLIKSSPDDADDGYSLNLAIMKSAAGVIGAFPERRRR